MPEATASNTTDLAAPRRPVDTIRTIDALCEVRAYVLTVASALAGMGTRSADSDAVQIVAYEAADKLQAVIDRLYGRDNVGDDEEEQA